MAAHRRTARRRRTTAILSALLLALAATLVAPPVGATAGDRSRRGGHGDHAIVLPGATSAEGITAWRGTRFLAGDLVAGDIFVGDVQRRSAELFIDAPEGRMAIGMAVDRSGSLLFVAGGSTGQGYVYDLRSRSTVATYQFAAANSSFINDVVVTRGGAWFTNSSSPELYFVAVSHHEPADDFATLHLRGPAAGPIGPGEFGLNGIVATGGGHRLVVAHSTFQRLYAVDPRTGDTTLIEGPELPGVDGLVLRGRRLWAVQNSEDQIAEIRLAGDLTSGQVADVITSELFDTPTTAGFVAGRLAVVNAKFGDTFPPTADQYEVIVLGR